MRRVKKAIVRGLSKPQRGVRRSSRRGVQTTEGCHKLNKVSRALHTQGLLKGVKILRLMGTKFLTIEEGRYK